MIELNYIIHIFISMWIGSIFSKIKESLDRLNFYGQEFGCVDINSNFN